MRPNPTGVTKGPSRPKVRRGAIERKYNKKNGKEGIKYQNRDFQLAGLHQRPQNLAGIWELGEPLT